MVKKEIIKPDSLAKPSGYSHGILVRGGAVLFIAGQVGWDADKRFPTNGMEGQFEQALKNLRSIVEKAGGRLTDIVKLTIYVTDKGAYFAKSQAIGSLYRRYFGRYYPAMTLVEVKSLAENEALLEIDGIAVIEGAV